MGNAQPASAESLYERDFYAWTQDQAARLRGRAHNEIDWENAAEEIESVGRSQKKEIRSRMKVLIQHLLKWEHQSARRSHSWQSSISEQRTHIAGILETSPSLWAFPAEVLPWAYRSAVPAAALEMELAAEAFPFQCAYAVEDILDERFMPGPPWHPSDLIRD